MLLRGASGRDQVKLSPQRHAAPIRGSLLLSPVFHHADNGYIDRSAGSRALIDGGWSWKRSCKAVDERCTGGIGDTAAHDRVDEYFNLRVLDSHHKQEPFGR